MCSTSGTAARDAVLTGRWAADGDTAWVFHLRQAVFHTHRRLAGTGLDRGHHRVPGDPPGAGRPRGAVPGRRWVKNFDPGSRTTDR